jgi:hypothetical protein
MRTITATDPTTHAVSNPSDLVPISVLALDLDLPIGSWTLYLEGRGVAVLQDDIGRPAITRADARWLILERREAEARAREVAERMDAEREAQRLAQLPAGLPADQVPTGMTPAMAMVAADPDLARRPRRTSVLEEQLAGGGLVFHPLGPDGEAS